MERKLNRVLSAAVVAVIAFVNIQKQKKNS